MTEPFWKRTLWSGSASTGMEVCEEVCCATNIAGNAKREIRPIFMLKTPEARPRENRQYRTPVFARKDFWALTISPEHTSEERFLAALGMTAKKICAESYTPGQSRGAACCAPTREFVSEAGCAGGGGAHFRGVYAEAKMSEVGLAQGHEAGVEVAPDEKQQEGDGREILVGNGVDDRAREINSEENFRVGHPTGFVAVCLGYESVLLAFDLEFWGAGKFAFYSENGFEDGFGVADRDADSGGHHEGHVEESAVPGFRTQLLLRDEIETGNRAMSSQNQW